MGSILSTIFMAIIRLFIDEARKPTTGDAPAELDEQEKDWLRSARDQWQGG